MASIRWRLVAYRPQSSRGTDHAGAEAKGPQENKGAEDTGRPGTGWPSLGTPASPQAHGAYPPGHEGVCFLQRRGVQFKERGDVVAMGHSHQTILDLLPRVPAT